MKYTTFFSQLEKICYEFDENDIRQALITKYNLGITPAEAKGRRWDSKFEILEDPENEGHYLAELTIIYEKENTVDSLASQEASQ